MTRGQEIKKRLEVLQKLTKAEKTEDNCEALEQYLHDIWCITHPKRNIYNEQSDNFWEDEMKI